jgi:uncharacterized protein
MHFDLKSFYERAREPFQKKFELDLSHADFRDYRVPDPVACVFMADVVSDGVQMELEIQVTVQAECARCLTAVENSYDIRRSYLVKLSDLEDPDFELPLDAGKKLDIDELVFQEIILEVPRTFLCNPHCLGLCPICGRRKLDGCMCKTAEDSAPVDARLSILKQLLS